MDLRASVEIIFRTVNMPTPPGMPVGQRCARAVVLVVVSVHTGREVAVGIGLMRVVEMWR